MPTLTELDKVHTEKEYEIIGFWCYTFAELCERLRTCVPLQKDGRPNAISNTGEPYVEFFAKAYCRSDAFDVKVAERAAIANISSQLQCYLSNTNGTIYWRMRPEDDLLDYPQIIGYAEDGPDMDFYTEKMCFKDKNWKKYCVYMRLLRSDKPELEE